MSQPESQHSPVTLNIKMADASDLSIKHVNALDIRPGIDEFFLTLGVVIPPDQTEMESVKQAGHIVAQPVFRFAISRDTMEKFLAVMAGQYDQQTTIINQLRSFSGETNNKEEMHIDE